MTDIQAVIENYDYFNHPMVNENNQLTSLNALIAALGINSEIDFYLDDIRWYIGPSNAGYTLSKNNGTWKKSFKTINDLLNYKINGKTLRSSWKDMLINEL
ncbi:hypothetical protein [uncultured Lactobacillus sp.]|uniref:hypothetical protein n=1 Tax=uncultured Lactobacillus sp. TaxID=153152 RepID=UPI00272988B1|nr:hypothetical protein [uncultured Lactobacillus sp.]